MMLSLLASMEPSMNIDGDGAHLAQALDAVDASMEPSMNIDGDARRARAAHG